MEEKVPYSAEHPVSPKNFAGREKQITDFVKFLDNTIAGNSKNIVILGEWGVGKTSLLRMFKKRAEKKHCVGTIIELGQATDSYITLFETIIRSLARDAQTTISLSAKANDFLGDLSLSASYGPMGLGFAKRKNIPPDTIKFRDDLIKIYGQIHNSFLIMLDNAEQLLNIKGSIFELRNIFQTIQSMDEVRCMLILSGKETLFSDIRSVSEPAARFFWGIELKSFNIEETKEAIKKPLINSNVNFDDDCIKKIHNLSQGHPYFVQVFAYNLFMLKTGNKITLNDLNSNFNRVLNFLGTRLFDSLMNMITPTEREVVMGFAKSNKDALTNTELSKIIKVKSINQYLIRLSEFSIPIVVKLERGKYSLYHPLFKEYLKQIM